VARAASSGSRVLSWAASILIAVIFLSEGAAKFPEGRLWLRVFDQIGFGQWFRYFTGVVEIAGASLILVPATRLWGAALLACTMCGALLVHGFIMGIGLPTAGVAVLLLTLVAIGVDSFKESHRNQSGLSDRVPV
jgi:putative oxidoreductase